MVHVSQHKGRFSTGCEQQKQQWFGPFVARKKQWSGPLRPLARKSVAGVTKDFEELLDAFLRREVRFAIIGTLSGCDARHADA